MVSQSNNKSIRLTIWASRILRWGLGGLFVAIGIAYYNQDGWPAIIFGAVMIITGFFRPKRCIDDGCDISEIQKK
jgi:hypothetical protein